MKDAIHIVEVEAHDFHRLKVAQVEHIPGKGLGASGKNGAGKTSLLRAIVAALGGTGKIEDAAIHEGADKGSVRLKLSNGFQIVRTMTEASPKGYLSVIGPDGGRHAQGKLNEWVGPRAFDPLAFFSLAPAKQREVLLSIGTDAELGAKIDALRVRYKAVYDDRTPWISTERRYRATKPPAGERPEVPDVADLVAELNGLSAQATEKQRAVQAFRDMEPVFVASQRKVWELQAALDQAIEEMEVNRTKGEALKQAAESHPDRHEEIKAVKATLAEVDAKRAELGPWEDYDRAQAALKEATKEVGARTKKLDTMQAKERKLLADAGLPIDGLTFDAETGDPLLNERPLAVASGREQIDLAVEVAFAANPELRICLLDEANDLDLEAMENLGQKAVDRDFQIWAVRLGLEGPGDIEVVDGVAEVPQ